MRSLHLSLVLLCIYCIRLLVASEASDSLSSQTAPSCQMGRVGVTTERITSRLGKRMITITVTSTSTDTTDCTCTETTLSTPSSTKEAQTTSSLLESSSPQVTASRTSTEFQSTSTDLPVTSSIPDSSKTTIGDVSTVTDWSITTVVSFITLTASSSPALSSTLGVSTSSGIETTSDPTQNVSLSLQYTTVTIHDTSYATRWTTVPSTTTLTGLKTSSSSDVSIITKTEVIPTSSAVSVHSSTTMVSTNTGIDTSATGGSQVEISPTVQSTSWTESTPDASSLAQSPSTSIQYSMITVHDTSYLTSGITTSVPSDTTITKPIMTSSADLSTSSDVTGLSSPSLFGNSALVVTVTTVVDTTVTESQQHSLSTTVTVIRTTDMFSSTSVRLEGQHTEREPEPSLADKTGSSLLSDTTYVGQTATKSHTGEPGAITSQTSNETSVNPASLVPRPSDSHDTQYQTNSPSDVVSSASSSVRPSLSICPPRVVNPTYTPISRPPRDYTWGCPPHSLCSPSKKTANGECNFEAGVPADTYYCAPDECIPSPPLPKDSSQGWTTSSNQIRYTVAQGFINLSPLKFGLGYDIFEFPDLRANAQREWAVKIPGKCYDSCNNAMEAAESITKTHELCSPDSPFQVSHRACKSCVESGSVVRTSSSALPEFQQFLFYCDGVTNATSTIRSHSATNSRGKTSSSMPLATSTTGTVSSSLKKTVDIWGYTGSHAKYTSTKRIDSTSSRLPTSTKSHLIYTGGAALRYPFRPLLEIPSVFLLYWFTF